MALPALCNAKCIFHRIRSIPRCGDVRDGLSSAGMHSHDDVTAWCLLALLVVVPRAEAGHSVGLWRCPTKYLEWDRGCSPLGRFNAGKDCVSGAGSHDPLGGKVLVMQMAVVALEQ